MNATGKNTDVKVSKRLSFVLRHDPGSIGIRLDQSGWTSVRDLLSALKKDGLAVDEETLRRIVATNEKKRFTLSEDGRMIRAAQGHSVEVDLGLSPSVPPAVLYHGTAARNLNSIFEKGILSGSRRQVHLSCDIDTAISVGARHGRPVVLEVDTGMMAQRSHLFYKADNGVWLTDFVPPDVLRFAAMQEDAEAPAPASAP